MKSFFSKTSSVDITDDSEGGPVVEDTTLLGPRILQVVSETGVALCVLGCPNNQTNEETFTYEVSSDSEERRLRLTDLSVAIRYFLGTISHAVIETPEGLGAALTIEIPGTQFRGNWRYDPDEAWLYAESSVETLMNVIRPYLIARPRIEKRRKRARESVKDE